MKKFVSYLSGIPAGEKNLHKKEILLNFSQGVANIGDDSIAHNGTQLIPAEVAFIQGWVHEGSPKTPHLVLRKSVAEFQKNNGNHTLIVDSNLFNYKDANKSKTYSRFSFDGVFPTTGNYFWDNPDPIRWQKISRDLGISLKDWQTNGSHILICTQRNGGWSMKGLDVISWLKNTITEIKKYSSRPIVIRPHPGDRFARSYLSSFSSVCTISNNEYIWQDFINAHAVVTYNSSPGVAAAIEGIPVFVTDPNPKVSQACDVANTNLSLIENPKVFDRQLWIEKLSMCHWNREEISNGEAWAHVRKYI